MRRRIALTAIVATLLVIGTLAVRLRTGSAPLAASVAMADEAGSKATTFYTCGMHPEVVQDHPGNCPKCGMKLHPMSPDRAAAMGLTPEADPTPSDTSGSEPRKVLYWKSSMIPGEIHKEPGKDSMGMDLVPVYEDEAASAGTIRIDPVTEQDMGVRVDTVSQGPLRHTVRAVGYVAYDETTVTQVSTKVDGWVEKLYADRTGMQVHKNEPLFELYSPALFSAQEEYLAALRNLQPREVKAIPRSRADSEELVRAARTRLEFFDISSGQIDELERTKKVRKTLTIRAPFTGIVTQKNVVEGQMVKAGAEVFQVADLSTVWVLAKVYEQDLPYVHLGQEAFMTLTYLPGRTFHGRVTYVYPYLEKKTREISVRMEFHNPGYELKPGMYATVTLTDEVKTNAVLIPDTAIIDTGTRAVAFVSLGHGHFEAREIRRGLRSDDNRIQVLDGVAPGETVVVSGQFLLDSESRLREAAMKFLPAGKVDGAQPIKATTAAHADHTASKVSDERTYWVCPMPAHSDTLYDKPGKCPICGMQLVEVHRRGAHLQRPKIAYWTCPMPEHHSVRKSGPGKCPICGMTLIPVPEAK
jgi:Cu(I)/Ag(I) efflux system membrane fusion protein